jgi:predicted glutamine amidotransferase
LLGVVSAAPISVADAVGANVLKDFVALTKLHGDGWGIAAVERPGDSPRVQVSAASALDDPEFARVTENLRSVASLVHLRWATSGLAVEPRNSHPFLADGVAMAHNGSIKPIELLDTLLDPALVAGLGGTTDSERYFALIRQHRASAPTLAEAVRRAVAQLRGHYPAASLNALVLGEDQLIAVHAHARSSLSAEDIAELGAVDLPAEHNEDYFALRWARPDDETVVVGSTGFGALDWQPLPPESVTAFFLRDLTMSVVPVDTE